MMTLLWWILIILCLCFGILGCFINKIPGPIAVLLAVLIAKVGVGIDFSWGTVAIVAALAILSIVLSKVLVKGSHKIKEFSKKAGWGTTVGSLLGLFILAGAGASKNESGAMILLIFVLGLVVMPFIFAFLFELSEKKGVPETLKCALSATSVYLFDTFLKLVVFGYAVYAMFASK